MKIKCNKIISCGNYNCVFNMAGECSHTVISLGTNGQCALCKLKPELKCDGGKPAQNKSNVPFDIETSK